MSDHASDLRERQNQPELLALRAAIFRTFNRPKQVYTLVFYGTLLLAVLTVVDNLWLHRLTGFLAFVTALILVVEIIYRLWGQKQLEAGAVLADLYDYRLYGLPVPAGRTVRHPSVTDVMPMAAGVDTTPFRDWYQGLDLFPAALQPLVCQLINATWDYQVRVRLSQAALWSAGVYGVGIVALAAGLNRPFRETAMTLLLPALPFLYQLLVLHVESRTSLLNLHGVKNGIEAMLRRADDTVGKETLYAHQEHLFKHRASAFPIPNVIHSQVKGNVAKELQLCLEALSSERPSAP
ncbi:S-4TM family putative pore-forming effector [Deinococcus sp.]|uniref:S-4TM family putative pore-forming effector n=1 Tax=Deinococcus sp. TaxID=47478 RepID=UPI0025BEC5BC|nr:S-4TM family putative pore-forming effector [Deinococcus sp.]